ncbi:MAG: glycosyltransferase [Candidatus Sumerlaeaceae bacterium]|nr:glycosyltransferase [Candidatus Sumerlaeaceae bacterium]
MSNVLVLGVGPLPVDPSEKLYAPGLRTWHFAESIAKKRHNVMLGLIDFGDFSDNVKSYAGPQREEAGEFLTILRLKYHRKQTSEALRTLHIGCKFNCVVSTTDIMNGIAASLPFHLPLWLDYNGEPFAEKQLQAMVHNNDAALYDQWKLLFQGLLAGDRFSTASEAQKYALIGQLGFAGRLNARTSGERLVHKILPCSRAMAGNISGFPVAVKARLIPADCFMILWSGGYNSWCDPEVLFHGIEIAMRRNPRIYFISTGGEIGGHDTETFSRFQKLVEESDIAHRFHFSGWVPTEQMPSYYRQADVAINVDSFSYECELGHRNRIVDWMLYQTPVLTTELCEFTRTLSANELVYTFPIGDAEAMAGELLRIASDPEAAKGRAKRAKRFLDTEYDEMKVLTPLLNWVAAPEFSGDRTEQGLAPSSLAALHGDLLKRHASGMLHHGKPSLLKRVLSKVTGTRA